MRQQGTNEKSDTTNNFGKCCHVIEIGIDRDTSPKELTTNWDNIPRAENRKLNEPSLLFLANNMRLAGVAHLSTSAPETLDTATL